MIKENISRRIKKRLLNRLKNKLKRIKNALLNIKKNTINKINNKLMKKVSRNMIVGVEVNINTLQNRNILKNLNILIGLWNKWTNSLFLFLHHTTRED